MAEVFLGEARGPAGFSKKVVIKRILPQFAESGEFVEMFQDEARLAALLNHPNVVQVYDFGEDGGVFYIAMEYIEGETLRSILRHHRDTKRPLPARLGVQIIIGVCEGLHYAHSLCDTNGVSFNVVHRDVTPENILVSSSGIPKVLDFGIAKASVRSSRTQAGSIKGKYAYMAPEQVRGEGVTRQVDVYALGVVLYELLGGKRPFEGETEYALLGAILEGAAKPLHLINPEVPEELSAIVQRALAVRLDARFPDVRSLQLKLEEFLHRSGAKVATVDLAREVAEVTQRRTGVRAPEALAETRGAEEAVDLEMPKTIILTAPLRTPTLVTPGGPFEASAAPAAASQDPGIAEPAVKRSRTARRWGLGLVAMLAAVGVGWRTLSGGSVTEAPAPAPVPVAEAPAVPTPEVTPTTAPEADAPQPEEAQRARAPDERPPARRAAAPKAARKVAVAAPSAEPSAAAAKPPATARDGFGSLTVRSDPWCDVFIDGVPVGVTPLAKLPVASGTHEVVLKNAQEGALRKLTVKIDRDVERKEVVLFPRGTLRVEADPAAQVSLNGRAIGVTPLQGLRLIEGTHVLTLVSKELGRSDTRRVEIKSGQEHVVRAHWGPR
jgi:serine/threonine-protein kinase